MQRDNPATPSTDDTVENNTTAAFSIAVEVILRNVPGVLGNLASAIGEAGGNITRFVGFEAKGGNVQEHIYVDANSEAHQKRILSAIDATEGVDVVGWCDRTFLMHEGGKIEVLPLAPVDDVDDLSMAYTPGVARVCTAIAEEHDKSFDLTIRKNTVAIVSDGSAVLGLGDIGPEAAMPVMEGKALLFKAFAGVDAFPICLDVSSADEIVETVERLAPTFGGVNLEDIKAPEAFEVEERLKASLDIPVFHDDQHGTAIVTIAALQNSLRLVGKNLADLKIVVSGVGAAGVAITKMLLNLGATNVVGADRSGAVHRDRDGLNSSKQWFADNTNPEGLTGSLSDLMAGTDVFIGVSGPDVLTVEDVASMAERPIVFAMANPDPEIRPELVEDIVAVMATGRSDFPNQINNVLAFPGVFKGALDVSAREITENMKTAAANAIARAVSSDDLAPDHIVPSVFDKSVVTLVADAVMEAARADGVCRLPR